MINGFGQKETKRPCASGYSAREALRPLNSTALTRSDRFTSIARHEVGATHTEVHLQAGALAPEAELGAIAAQVTQRPQVFRQHALEGQAVNLFLGIQ